MKKVLIFSYSYFPLVGGAEVAVKEITDRIAPEDIQFDMITRRFSKEDPSRQKIGNITVYRISASPYFFPFLAFLKASWLHFKGHYDVAWSIMANYAGFAALFFRIFHPRTQFFLTLQEGDSIDHIKNRVRYVQPLFKRIFTRADFIQPISNYLADFARNMGAVCPLEVVPNGVDVKKFQKIDLTLEGKLAQKLGIKGSDRIVITTSRLVEKNAISDLIASLQFLPEDIKLIIAGTGPLQDILLQQTQELGLASRVLFLGTISHDELPAYLHISNIFCRPSLSEGMGVSFVEAMAAGIPVIATNVGGIPDFLMDQKTGLFCDVKAPRSVAEKINTLFENRELSFSIIENAKKMVEVRYDWNIISEKMQGLFEKLA